MTSRRLVAYSNDGIQNGMPVLITTPNQFLTYSVGDKTPLPMPTTIAPHLKLGLARVEYLYLLRDLVDMHLNDQLCLDYVPTPMEYLDPGSIYVKDVASMNRSRRPDV